MSEENEIVVASKQAKDVAEGAQRAAAAARARRWQLGKLGLGVGIGSAAVVAAVMFAGRDRD